MKTIKYLISLLFVFNVFMYPAYSQGKYEELKEDFRKKIQKNMKKGKIPGACILLFRRDSIIWEEYFGYADKEREIRVTDETLFKIGSVSKLITGTAVMKLVQEGKMTIDDPVCDYIPEFSIKQRFEGSPPISSRMVLSHHAGLPSDILRGFESDSIEPYTAELDLLNEEYTVFPPNYIHAYSNPGINLMGILVSKVARVSYMDYVSNDIFLPLGMKDTYFWGHDPDPVQLSKNYNEKGDPVHESYIREIPAGGIISNVSDLSRFAMEWLPGNHRELILNKAHKNEMLRVQNEGIPLDLNQKYGIVWMINDDTGAGRIYHHGGATLYHISMLAIAPEADLGIILLTNASHGGRICYLYDEILEKAAEVEGINKKPANKDENLIVKYPEKRVYLTEDIADDYKNTYAFPGGIYTVDYKKGKLHTRIQNFKTIMIPVSDEMFIPKVKLFGFLGIKLKKVRFSFDEIGGEKIIIQEQTDDNRQDIIGVALEQKEISEAWIQRVGRYEIINNKPGDYQMIKEIELKKNEGLLELSFAINIEKGPMQQMGLVVLSDDKAYVAGLGRQGGYVIQVKQGSNGEELLYYSGYLMKKVIHDGK